jgi:hypothetical protein
MGNDCEIKGKKSLLFRQMFFYLPDGAMTAVHATPFTFLRRIHKISYQAVDGNACCSENDNQRDDQLEHGSGCFFAFLFKWLGGFMDYKNNFPAW